MDGTLVDSMGYWKRLAGEYLETHGVLNPPKDILEKIKPMTMTESAALFIREFGLQGTPEQVLTPQNIERVYGVSCTVERHPRTGRPSITYLPARDLPSGAS